MNSWRGKEEEYGADGRIGACLRTGEHGWDVAEAEIRSENVDRTE